MITDLVDYDEVEAALRDGEVDRWADIVRSQFLAKIEDKPHGDLIRWCEALESLPVPLASKVNLAQGLITVGVKSDSDQTNREAIDAALRGLHPWRKGPYQLHGSFVDTEWRSDWKWERLADHIDSLEGRRILDVGCGNGYHCWRMAGAGAKLVVGIDPSPLFLVQFHTVKRLISHSEDNPEIAKRVHLIPIGIEAVPAKLNTFDSVFSMGVLYHRRSPIDHIQELKDALRPGGQLILETLVVDGGKNHVLVPDGRYAKMRNVWFLPSVASLEAWLVRVGFKDVKTVDVTDTSTQEQRSTDWMQYESLEDFLDPADNSRTIEGYPAPKRAIVLARA